MKKRSKKTKRATVGKKSKKKRRSVDAQIREFESRDLGEDLQASGAGRIVRGKTRPTSILLEPRLIEELRKKGAKRGLGYQTMLKVIVHEHLHKY